MLVKKEFDIVAENAAMRHAINDVTAHIDAWVGLLETHIKSLPPDQEETTETDGCWDRSYAEHELHAMKRDLAALQASARDLMRRCGPRLPVGLCVSSVKLKLFLYKHFDISFSRPWDELPNHVREHWTKVAEELGPELLLQGIVECAS